MADKRPRNSRRTGKGFRSSSRRLFEFLRTPAISSNTVIAIFTGVIALTTLLQWKIAREQVAQTASIIQQMRLEQRAWLSVIAATIDRPAVGEQLSPRIRVQNTGATPANVTSIAVGTMVLPDLDVVANAYSALTEGSRQTIIPPGSAVNFPFESAKVRVNAKTYEAIFGETRTHSLFVIGRIEYRDTMDQDRLTQFCFIFEPSDGELRICHRHNQST